MIELPYNFYELVEQNVLKKILYSDTDSLFIHVMNQKELESKDLRLEENEKSIDNIVEKIVNPLSKKINENIRDYWNKKFLTKMNISEDWNTIDFKTEMIMDKIFLTGRKKRYAYRIFKKEKTYYLPPQIKITGIEIKRSDSSKLTKEIMMDIIRIMLTCSTVKEAKKKIKELIKNITKKFNESYTNYDFDYIGIPSSWSIKEYKSLPTYVYGALLYNLLVQDICRPGTKGYRIHIKLNKPKINDILKKTNSSSYQLNMQTFNLVKDKLDVIFLPPNYNKNKLKELVNKRIIEFDMNSQKQKILIDKVKPLIDAINSLQ